MQVEDIISGVKLVLKKEAEQLTEAGIKSNA